MDEKNKMYTTLIVAWVATTALVSGIYMADLNSDITGSSNTSAAKNSMSPEELEAFLWDTGNDEFVDTEGNNGEEIVVDEEALEYMPSVEEEFSQDEIEEKNLESTGSTESSEIPSEVNLEVTFYPQAPDADWSLPWKEACEESSVIQAYYYVQGKDLSKDTFRSEILSIVETQKKILGKYVDTNMDETAEFLRAQYGYGDYEIIDNPTIEDMKKELAQGHPIVAPFAWKELWNSFFSNGGPRYHVLVIVWYKDGFFITNDVGTSRGENFAYSYDTIMNAMHDLVPVGEWDILDGDKRILVLR